MATKEPAGTLIVDTPNTYLYYVLGGGRAIRYGVRVGRDGFTWTGVQKISRKAEWPDWHPPPEMIDRQPYLPRFMAGGPGNPLGARAMYLGSTVYRIHGTNQPSTIGKFVSSGCIGMLNDDVSDLFDRVKVGTRVVVLPGNPPQGAVASAQPIPGPNAGPVRAPSRSWCRRCPRRSRCANVSHSIEDVMFRPSPEKKKKKKKKNGEGRVRSGCGRDRASSQQFALRLALEPGVDAFDHLAVVVAEAFLGDVAEMRRQHGIVELAEGTIDRQRLDRIDVDGGARDLALLQCLQKCRLVDDGPRAVLTM